MESTNAEENTEKAKNLNAESLADHGDDGGKHFFNEKCIAENAC